MSDLERELVALGGELDAPRDDFLVTRVRAAIEQPARSRRRRLGVLVTALVGIGVVTVPVVGDVLRVGDVDVRQERPPVTATPAPLDLGRRTTLPAAAAAVGFTVAVPAELGAPDEVWLAESRAGATVWLAYRSRADLPAAGATGYGALVAQMAASISDDVLATKFVGPDATVERVELGTGPALWIDGVHHIGLVARSGDFVVDSLRLADRVLLWERGEVTMRLESALDKDASLRIARSTG